MHARLAKCRRCELVFANPAPARAALESLYRAASFEAGTESTYAARTYVACLRRTKGLLPVPTVDVGAGDGAFLLELMRNGFTDVIGYEPSEAPVRSADPAVRDRLRVGFFDAAKFPDDSLGLVTCFQTIEHVYDPLQLVRDIHRILKPGGIAFLIAHDVDALSAKILGDKSPIYDIEHLQLFNHASAATIMRSAGFSDVDVSSVSNTYPLAYWLKLFPLNQSIKQHLLTAMAGPLKPIGNVSISLPAGNLAMVATK